MRLEPGTYVVWARSWDTDQVDRGLAVTLGDQGPFRCGNHDRNGNWWARVANVALPEHFEARVAVPAEGVGCVHKLDALAFTHDEQWDPNAPETLPDRADAFCPTVHANDDRWFVTSGGLRPTSISYLNPACEPARDCRLQSDAPPGMEPWPRGMGPRNTTRSCGRGTARRCGSSRERV